MESGVKSSIRCNPQCKVEGNLHDMELWHPACLCASQLDIAIHSTGPEMENERVEAAPQVGVYFLSISFPFLLALPSPNFGGLILAIHIHLCEAPLEREKLYHSF